MCFGIHSLLIIQNRVILKKKFYSFFWLKIVIFEQKVINSKKYMLIQEWTLLGLIMSLNNYINSVFSQTFV
jgi:hypothetical protein